MKVSLSILILAGACLQVQSGLVNGWERNIMDDIIKRGQPIIDKIIDSVEKVTESSGLGELIKAIDKIKKIGQDNHRVTEVEITKKVFDVNKRIIDIKIEAKNNGIDHLDCLDDIEAELRLLQLESLAGLQECTHQLVSQTDDVLFAIANIYEKLEGIKDKAKNLITKCTKENLGIVGAMACITEHAIKYGREIKSLSNELRKAEVDLTNNLKSIIGDMRQCNNRVLKNANETLRQVKEDLDQYEEEAKRDKPQEF